MNEAQRQAIKARQRAAVKELTGGDEPAERAPAPPQRSTEEVMEELIAKHRPPVADGRPVRMLRFTDKSMKVAGMQSGDQLEAKVHTDGRRHTIEFIEGFNCFLVGFIDTRRHLADYDFIERSAVKTWKPAAP